jgi:hypothetical protein
MSAIYFTVAGIVLYLFADWSLQRMELAAGRRFEYRSLYFFFILLGLALVVFSLIRGEAVSA